jgi:error-prone DNA polymerase
VTDPFVHLHVASGYSLRHGASHPRALVQRAADHGMDTLALTDRDGTYGAVKFALACQAAGVRPVFGVDLAVAPVQLAADRWDTGGRSTGAGASAGPGAGLSAGSGRSGRASPARGGSFLDRDPDSGDPGLPRVVLLARDRRGWAALCRLVSATHLAGERGVPVSTLDLVAEHAGGAAQDGALAVLLGPASELGRAVAARRDDLARAHLSRWRDVLGRESVVVEVVCHRGPGDVGRAARLLGFAQAERAGAVLTNVVRYADRSDAPTADVLDAARRLVALDLRHVDRRNAEAALLSGKEMGLVAEQVARAAGLGDDGPRPAGPHPVRGRAVRGRPAADLGIGRCTSPSWRSTAASPARCCARAARPASAGGRWWPTPAPGPGSRTSWASSPGSATRRTSSPWPTSSTSSRAWACGWRRGGAAPARWSPTCSGSATSTRSATGC